ncbi:MAG: ABC transporter ATP-binding protein [Patescibacteria group bacterium]|jgi:ATP-binding cassette subfamily B protein
MKNKALDTLKIYWSHVARRKGMFFAIVICVILASATDAFSPIFLKRIFNVISSEGNRQELFKIAFGVLLILAGLEIFHWTLRRIFVFLDMRFISRTQAEINVASFKHLFRQSFSFFADSFSGALVKKVNYFSRAFEGLFESLFWNILPTVVNTLIIFFVLLFNNWKLGLAVLVWMLIFYPANFLFSRWKYKYDVIVNEATSKNSGFLADTISNSSNLKLFNGYERETKLFIGLNNDYAKKNIFAWSKEELFNAVTAFLMIILEIGLFFITAYLWREGKLTVGDFALVQFYVLMLIMQGWHFGQTIRNVYRAFSDAEEMTEILLTVPAVLDFPQAKKLKISQGEINFKNASFNYHSTRKILENFNLSIKPGEKIALIGPSGAGKTTIVKLLLRNFDINSGSVEIDGQDIAKVTQESLWSKIGLVSQEPILFHRSLKENIAYGCPGASAKEIEEASHTAHCHEFISSFPDGYETMVGERGVKLSGGERQRVSIARAILKNAPIFILDEATSSLDSESEGFIQEGLERLMVGKTVIAIAHRLSTIRKMDRILVIDSGKIVEEGTHEELKDKSNGHYAKLWDLQAGGFIKEENEDETEENKEESELE